MKTITKEELIDKLLTQAEYLEKIGINQLSTDGRKNLISCYTALSTLIN